MATLTSEVLDTRMDISVRTGEVLQEPSELGMLGSFEGSQLPAEVSALFEPADFSGKAGQTLLLYPRGAVAPRRLLLVGLGKRDALDAEAVRQAGASAVRRAREMQVPAITLGINGELPIDPEEAGQAFAEGIELGAYRYWHYRTNLTTAETFEVQRSTLLAASNERETKFRAGIDTGHTIGCGVRLARDLVNNPAYTMTPARLGEEAESIAQRAGLKVMVLDKDELVEQGFGGVLAVGRGSANDPRFIAMEYGSAGVNTPTICITGKGITFDSGGMSLKPAEAMETMKNDMSGAATVLALMEVVAELKLPVHLVGLISAAENMPSTDSYRPGDIVTTLSGKTIEVLNTDAEGRVVLADALFYAQRYHPAAIINVATLTGAMIIALGDKVTGMMSTNQDLADAVMRAGEASGERVWQFPLWNHYHEMVKSDIADLKNMAGRPAGSITAGAFLAAFAGEYPFLHLDIAGTSWADKPTRAYETQGGTGVGVRLLTEFLRNYRN